eukprot:bmy_06733T0
MRPESQEAENQQVKRGVTPQGPPVLRPSLMSLQLLAPRHQGWGERSLAPWPTWSLEKVGHSSPKDACESKQASVHVAHMQEPSTHPTGPVDTHDTHLCYADGLGLVECLWAPTSPSSLLPLRGGRQRANLFTTSAPGSGDELRLAHCPPRAGPGLSHGGQMTAEAKRVRSCSPQELLEAPPYPRRFAVELSHCHRKGPSTGCKDYCPTYTLRATFTHHPAPSVGRTALPTRRRLTSSGGPDSPLPPVSIQGAGRETGPRSCPSRVSQLRVLGRGAQRRGGRGRWGFRRSFRTGALEGRGEDGRRVPAASPGAGKPRRPAPPAPLPAPARPAPPPLAFAFSVVGKEADQAPDSATSQLDASSEAPSLPEPAGDEELALDAEAGSWVTVTLEEDVVPSVQLQLWEVKRGKASQFFGLMGKQVGGIPPIQPERTGYQRGPVVQGHLGRGGPSTEGR